MIDELQLWSTTVGETPKQIEEIEQVEYEKHLEEMFIADPEMLLPGVKLVCRQLQTATGPLDLLGIDRDGRLVVFELKRDRTGREAVAQAVDYASWLDSLPLDELSQRISNNNARRMDLVQIGEFIDWYVERFSEDELTNVRPTLVVLVALGNDESVERMARWLRLGGINISALTFQAFADGARTLMARGWTGAGTDPGRSAAASVRRAQSDARSVALRADDDELFAAGMALFTDCFEGTPYLTSSTKKGLGFRLPEGPETSSRQTYARVNVDPQLAGLSHSSSPSVRVGLWRANSPRCRQL